MARNNFAKVDLEDCAGCFIELGLREKRVITKKGPMHECCATKEGVELLGSEMPTPRIINIQKLIDYVDDKIKNEGEKIPEPLIKTASFFCISC